MAHTDEMWARLVLEVGAGGVGCVPTTAHPLRRLLDFQSRLESDSGEDLRLVLLVKLLVGTGSFSVAAHSSWFKVAFCCRLLQQGHASRLPPSILARGYDLALRLVEDEGWAKGGILQEPVTWGAAGTVERLLALVHSVLAQYATSLSLRAAEARSHAILLLEAFLCLALRDADDAGGAEGATENGSCSASIGGASDVAYLARRGLPLGATRLLKHAVVLDIAPPVVVLSNAHTRPARRGVLSMRRVIVAVFEASLELPAGAFPHVSDCSVKSEAVLDGASVADVEAQHAEASPKAREFRLLEEWARVLQRSHVGVVVCQRTIHPHLSRALARLGIACLPRVSVVHIGSILRAAGARQLGGLSWAHAVSAADASIDSSQLGFLSFLGTKSLLGTEALVAEAGSASQVRAAAALTGWTMAQRGAFVEGVLSRRHPLSTLLVAAPSNAQCAEAERAYQHVFACLQEMLSSPRPALLAGGGEWQREAAALLSRAGLEDFCSTRRKKREQEEREVKELDDGKGGGGGRFPFATRAAGRSQRGTGDVLAAAELFARALRAGSGASAAGAAGASAAVETLGSSRVALRAATEAAICLLEIDGAM